MKKIIFSALFMIAGFFLLNAQDIIYISGQVTDIEDGDPIPNHEVFVNLNDSLGFFYYVTDQDGNYGDSIVIGGINVNYIQIYTFDCNWMMHDTTVTDWSNPIVANFEICGDPTGGNCQAAFAAIPDSTDWLTIHFMDLSVTPNGTIDSWAWEFGDGVTSSEQNPIHTYASAGVYTVCLTIEEESSNCENTFCMDITVEEWPGGGCTNSFTATTNDFLTYAFSGEVYPPATTTYEWDFGDGTYGTGQNVTHTFDPVGGISSYLVCLTTYSTDSLGDTCLAYSCQPVWVGNQQGCEASFWARPDSGMYTYQFMDMSWGDPTSWFWEFGDGNTSTEQNPYHTYEAQGNYLICLTIEGDSCSDTYCDSLMVGYIPEDCLAQYIYFPLDSLGGTNDLLSYQFLDVSIGYPTSWTWDFGDGTTSTEQNPIHIFLDYGVYWVCLTIANDSCTDTFCDSVYVSEWPGGNCFSWFTYEVDDLTVDFEGFTYSPYATTYFWDFGDGSGSLVGQSVTHTYDESGAYTVTLTTIDSLGCTWTTMMDVWAGEPVFSINGYVYVELGFADEANVYLMTFDTLANNLVTVDTTQVGDNGYYEFDSVQIENWRIYYVQAELLEQSIYFGQYLPTYHYASLTWQEAWPVFPVPMGITHDVFMLPGTFANSGNGSIAGTVHSGETRGLLNGVEMVLFTHDNQPLTYIRTNEEGRFDFSQLAWGTYIVHTEIVGINASPITLTLSEDNPDTDISIIVQNGMAALGVEDTQSEYLDEVGYIYPNPVGNQARVEVSLLQQSDVHVIVFNHVGQMVYNRTDSGIRGKTQIEVNTAKLKNGFYTLQIITDDGATLIRKFIKMN